MKQKVRIFIRIIILVSTKQGKTDATKLSVYFIENREKSNKIIQTSIKKAWSCCCCEIESKICDSRGVGTDLSVGNWSM